MSQSVKGTRDLRKLIPKSILSIGEDLEWDLASPLLNGWEIYTDTSGTAPVRWALYRTYVDIVGWTKDDITAFTQGAAFQESNRWVASLGGILPILNTWDIVSVNSIDNSAFNEDKFSADPFLAPLNWSAPGMMGSNYNLEEILAGRYRSFAESTDVTATAQTNLQVWGSGDATAGDRIHITRAVLLDDTTVYPGQIFIPEMAIVIPTVLVREPDLVYMERLRRSYVLQENR